MIMNSIIKRPLEPFDLLGLAIFASSSGIAWLILSWKVLVTRPSTVDISARPLEKIKRLSTYTHTNHSPWLHEKALAYPFHPKELSTTNSISHETSNRHCFITVLNISIEGFFMAKTRQLFGRFHFSLVRMLDGLLFPSFFPGNLSSIITSTLASIESSPADKRTPLINIFCAQIKLGFQSRSLRKTHNPNYCYKVTSGGIKDTAHSHKS